MSTKQLAAAQTRSRLIEAAIRTLETHGTSGLTLDAVAKEAGVSKGGLLHHFPSKEVLHESIIRHLMTEFAARAKVYYDQEIPRPGRWLRAYVHATFEETPPPLELSAMLMLTLTENAGMLNAIREDFHQWQMGLLEDGLPIARALVVRLAADAYWFDRLIGISPHDDDTRQKLLNELLALTEVTPV
ncbi:MAG: TetR/AcrR family transcriptional regulator [Anaerolineae bacterium]|nr:TetR/AcrR family transcriptional regulator [Anaerolineae bacterium]